MDKLANAPADRLTPAQLHHRLQRAYTRMQDSAAFMIGVAQELPGARAVVQPHIDRVRAAIAGLKDALELLTPEEG